MNALHEIPSYLLKYKDLQFTEKTLSFLTNRHNTKVGTWGEITLNSGDVSFEFLSAKGESLGDLIDLKIGEAFLVSPSVWHRLVIRSDKKVKGQMTFYCHPLHYFHKKHALTKPHSHVVNLAQNYLSSSPLDILDMGCGSGRNSLYLNHLEGHHVASVDIDADKINALQNIIQEEKLANITATVMDLEKPNLNKQYDLILLNVVLQFLKDGLFVLELAQKNTKLGGFHSIVCPVITENMEWPKHFSFLLKPSQLSAFYRDRGWAILDYNEDFGSLHRLDKNGFPIRGKFASLIAQKILD